MRNARSSSNKEAEEAILEAEENMENAQATVASLQPGGENNPNAPALLVDVFSLFAGSRRSTADMLRHLATSIRREVNEHMRRFNNDVEK